MKAFLQVAGIGMIGLIAAYFVVALALIYWPVQIFKNRPPTPVAAKTDYPHTEQRFVMRDGKHLFARVFGPPAGTTVVLVHGFGVNSIPYQRAASLWSQASGARIITLDLRGHGRSEGKPGRADYVGQYEDDLGDVIDSLRKEGPGQIVLAGHSMGGGIVLSYAMKPAQSPDAYLLIAPLLGNNAPTAPATGGPATVPSTLYVRIPRIIGVVMFSLVGVHFFEDLPVMYLNQTPPMTYGLNAVSSMGPRDYRAAFAAIKVPLLLIAGSKDEVFRAYAYAEIIKQYSHGQSVLVEGETHVGVLADPAAVGEIKKFIERLHGPEMQGDGHER